MDTPIGKILGKSADFDLNKSFIKRDGNTVGKGLSIGIFIVVQKLFLIILTFTSPFIFMAMAHPSGGVDTNAVLFYIGCIFGFELILLRLVINKNLLAITGVLFIAIGLLNGYLAS